MIGGIVGAVLTMAVSHVMPIGAQNGDATFGEITCTGIKVKNAEGENKVLLGTHEDNGVVIVKGKAGSVSLMISEQGGDVSVHGKEMFGAGASMGIDHEGQGGIISVSSAEILIAAMMSVTNEGGSVHVSGEGEHGFAYIGMHENGGVVSVTGRDGEYRRAKMNVDENGGVVSVYGRGSDYSRALMGVSESGSAAVSAWDKNGYRLATLK